MPFYANDMELWDPAEACANRSRSDISDVRPRSVWDRVSWEVPPWDSPGSPCPQGTDSSIGGLGDSGELTDPPAPAVSPTERACSSCCRLLLNALLPSPYQPSSWTSPPVAPLALLPHLPQYLKLIFRWDWNNFFLLTLHLPWPLAHLSLPAPHPTLLPCLLLCAGSEATDAPKPAESLPWPWPWPCPWRWPWPWPCPWRCPCPWPSLAMLANDCPRLWHEL